MLRGQRPSDGPGLVRPQGAEKQGPGPWSICPEMQPPGAGREAARAFTALPNTVLQGSGVRAAAEHSKGPPPPPHEDGGGKPRTSNGRGPVRTKARWAAGLDSGGQRLSCPRHGLQAEASRRGRASHLGWGTWESPEGTPVPPGHGAVPPSLSVEGVHHCGFGDGGL